MSVLRVVIVVGLTMACGDDGGPVVPNVADAANPTSGWNLQGSGHDLIVDIGLGHRVCRDAGGTGRKPSDPDRIADDCR